MVDVAEEMKAVEAKVGGRVGDAVSGVRAEASRLRGAGAGLRSGLRGIVSKVAGLSVAAMICLGIVAVAVCAAPIATWSAYHSGKAVQAERDRAADAEAVTRAVRHDKAVIADRAAKLARTDEADKAEIVRLHRLADRLSHKPTAKPLCPSTVYDVLRASGYTPTPGHE